MAARTATRSRKADARSVAAANAGPVVEPGGDRQFGQAVVIVHGMGEQRPMQTIRGFVKAVWNSDLSLTEGKPGRRTSDPDNPDVKINKSWIKPDGRAKSYELRRITTPYDVSNRRTDFYELYWADVTQGNTIGRLRAWMMGLLLRRFSDVPRDARKLYFAGWIAVLVFLLPTVATAWMKWQGSEDFILPGWLWPVIGAALAALLSGLLLPYLGDVAAYVRAEPDTIEKRAEVRERGRALLRSLMDSPSYDRVVIVAHSLGCIIAYDLLQILWEEYGPGLSNPRHEPEILGALRAVGKHALPLDSKARAAQQMDDAERSAFRAEQWRTYVALRSPPKVGKPWKISDFVTFGSPLTHAEFLVTRNAADFRRSIEERMIATCPPVREGAEKTILFGQPGKQNPHHASVFAATRWTNIYDKGNGWLTGDPISGPLTENFGPGVENIRVRLKWRLGRIFTHTEYWSLKAKGFEVLRSGNPGPRNHLDVMRAAVDLGRRLEPPPPPAEDSAET
jgi:hypothetical protein